MAESFHLVLEVIQDIRSEQTTHRIKGNDDSATLKSTITSGQITL